MPHVWSSLCYWSSWSCGICTGLLQQGGNTTVMVSNLERSLGLWCWSFCMCVSGKKYNVFPAMGMGRRCPTFVGKGESIWLAHRVQKWQRPKPTLTVPLHWALAPPPSRCGDYGSCRRKSCSLRPLLSCAPGLRSVRWVWAPAEITFVLSSLLSSSSSGPLLLYEVLAGMTAAPVDLLFAEA